MCNMFFVLFSLAERSEGADMTRKWFSSVQTVGERRKQTVHLDFSLNNVCEQVELQCCGSANISFLTNPDPRIRDPELRIRGSRRQLITHPAGSAFNRTFL